MELIHINSSKLKIMLSKADMLEYELDCDTFNYDNTETRRAFWNILKEVKTRTGFDAAADRVFIQLYPSKDGGCEIYVTKVGALCRGERSLPGPITYGPSKLLPEGEREKINLSFMFCDIEQMLAACRLATRTGQINSSDAWIDENGVLYLFVEASAESADTAFLSGILNEFGTPVSNPDYVTYIKEHGRAFCESNAVEILSVL